MNDDKKKRILAVFGLLFVLVLGWQGYQMVLAPAPATTWKTKSGSGTTSKAAPTQKAAPATVVAADGTTTIAFQETDVDIDRLLQDIEVVNFDYQTAHIQRDPMTPLVGLIRPQTDMTAQAMPTRFDVLNKNVTGIIEDPVAPAAVVDDEVVGIGHVYPDGTTVQSIERDRVVFRIGDSLIPVEMKKVGMR